MGPQRTGGDPERLLPLTPVTLNILLALADEERHGYGIGLEVRERTGGKMRLGPGTLYGSLKRMVAGGLVEEVVESESLSEEEPEGAPRRYDAERRRYYRLIRNPVEGFSIEAASTCSGLDSRFRGNDGSAWSKGRCMSCTLPGCTHSGSVYADSVSQASASGCLGRSLQGLRGW